MLFNINTIDQLEAALREQILKFPQEGVNLLLEKYFLILDSEAPFETLIALSPDVNTSVKLTTALSLIGLTSITNAHNQFD